MRQNTLTKIHTNIDFTIKTYLLINKKSPLFRKKGAYSDKILHYSLYTPIDVNLSMR